MPARRELQWSSRKLTIATAIVFAASVVSDERMWRRARMWKYHALTNLQNLLIERHMRV